MGFEEERRRANHDENAILHTQLGFICSIFFFFLNRLISSIQQRNNNEGLQNIVNLYNSVSKLAFLYVVALVLVSSVD